MLNFRTKSRRTTPCGHKESLIIKSHDECPFSSGVRDRVAAHLRSNEDQFIILTRFLPPPQPLKPMSSGGCRSVNCEFRSVCECTADSSSFGAKIGDLGKFNKLGNDGVQLTVQNQMYSRILLIKISFIQFGSS